VSLDYLKMAHPFRDTIYDHYLLIETAGYTNADLNEGGDSLLQEKMLSLFENMEGHYRDAFICESQTQMESFWKIRESISMGTAQYGLTLKFDVSLNSAHFDDLVQKTQAIINEVPYFKDKALVIGHGHIGDGNLHLNCSI